MKNVYRTHEALLFKNDFVDWITGKLLDPIETQNYFILQVAECNYNNSFSTNEHIQHCDLEITFPVTNSLFCATNGVCEQVNKNEVYLSFRGEVHNVSSRTGCRFQTLAINFKSGTYFSLFTELQKKFETMRKFSPSNVDYFFVTIISEFLNSDSFSTYNLDCSITALLVNFLRFGIERHDEIILSLEETLPNIINYIDSHFLKICSLEELSRFGYTYNHICKAFKKYYGFSPKHYLLKKKMEYTSLLLSQGKTLTEIAQATGYSSPYNLSRAFKSHFGVSPNDVKNNKSKEK